MLLRVLISCVCALLAIPVAVRACDLNHIPGFRLPEAITVNADGSFLIKDVIVPEGSGDRSLPRGEPYVYRLSKVDPDALWLSPVDGSAAPMRTASLEEVVLIGKAVHAVGGGKVTQLLLQPSACRFFESLLVTDCRAMETLVLPGEFPRWARREWEERKKAAAPGISLFVPEAPLRVENLFPPEGDLQIHPSTSIEDLRSSAIGLGYEVQDVDRYLDNLAEVQQFDPLIGCALFYPESPGASL